MYLNFVYSSGISDSLLCTYLEPDTLRITCFYTYQIVIPRVFPQDYRANVQAFFEAPLNHFTGLFIQFSEAIRNDVFLDKKKKQIMYHLTALDQFR